MNQLTISRHGGLDAAETQPNSPLRAEQSSLHPDVQPHQLTRRLARLAYLIEADAPDIVLRNERRLIEATIAALVADGDPGPDLESGHHADDASALTWLAHVAIGGSAASAPAL